MKATKTSPVEAFPDTATEPPQGMNAGFSLLRLFYA